MFSYIMCQLFWCGQYLLLMVFCHIYIFLPINIFAVLLRMKANCCWKPSGDNNFANYDLVIWVLHFPWLTSICRDWPSGRLVLYKGVEISEGSWTNIESFNRNLIFSREVFWMLWYRSVSIPCLITINIH